MGKRLEAEFTSIRGVHDYRVEIHDDQFLGTAQAFKLGGNGFSLSYSADTSERTATLLASQVEFTMYIENGFTTSFESGLIFAKEGRFSVQIFRNNILYWVGQILVDIITIQDEPTQPGRTMTVRATDGLGRLKDLDYNDNGTAYSGKQTLLQHVYNCLNRLGLLSQMAASPVKTSVGWRENNAASGDPFTTTRFDHKAFIKVDERGDFSYAKCSEVIKQILQKFNARIVQVDGVFWIVQNGQYVDNSMTVHSYNASGALTATQAGQTYSKTDNWNTGDMVRYSGGSFTYFPPLKSVEVEYKHFTAANLSVQRVLFDTQTYNIADIPSAGVTSVLAFSCKVQTKLTPNTPGNLPPVFVKYGLIIQIGTYYLSRPATVVSGGAVIYEGGVWTTTPSEYEFFTPPIDLEDQFFNQTIDILTPPIISSGDLLIRVAFQTYTDMNGGPIGTPTFTRESNFVDVYMEIITAGVISNRVQETVYTSQNTNADNSVVMKLESILGDGPFSTTLSRFDIYNGTSWEPSDLWSGLGQTTPQPLLQILANELMAGQSDPVQKINSSWEADTYQPHMVISYQGVNYLPLSAQLNAYRGEWEGEFFAVVRTVANATAGPIRKKIPRPGDILDRVGKEDQTPNPVTQIESIIKVLSPLFVRTVINEGVSITSLPVLPATRDDVFVTGDSIVLVNNITGERQTFTVSANVASGANSISINTATTNFRIIPGAVVVPEPQQQQSKINSPGFSAYQQQVVFPGSNVVTWTQNGGAFPPNTKAQLWVMLAGQKQVQDINYTLAAPDITISADLIWQETVVEVIAIY